MARPYINVPCHEYPASFRYSARPSLARCLSIRSPCRPFGPSPTSPLPRPVPATTCATALPPLRWCCKARAEGETDPTALLAAAQADYARLLAVLYEAGRISAGSSAFSLNGREAASYSALSRLPEVREIRMQRRSRPGLPFWHGPGRRPCLGGTRPPDSFAVAGAPASTEAIRGAAESARHRLAQLSATRKAE